MENFDLTNKCYKTKDDRLHSTIFSRRDLSQETSEEREERLKTLRENRGTWVWDEKKREVVRKEEYIPEKNVDAPSISLWQDEFAVVATGQRMSKRQLKQYAKSHGKIWENE